MVICHHPSGVFWNRKRVFELFLFLKNSNNRMYSNWRSNLHQKILHPIVSQFLEKGKAQKHVYGFGIRLRYVYSANGQNKLLLRFVSLSVMVRSISLIGKVPRKPKYQPFLYKCFQFYKLIWNFWTILSKTIFASHVFCHLDILVARSYWYKLPNLNVIWRKQLWCFIVV